MLIHSLAILTTALLFGGMTLYSFGFAAFLFSAIPAVERVLAWLTQAGHRVRRAGG